MKKSCLHPIRKSVYSNSVSSCHVMAYRPALALSTKIVPIQNSITPSQF